MPKPRHVPAHIDATKLPKGIWYDSKGNRWRIRQLDDATGKYKKIRLCSGQASLSQIWQAFEARQQHSVTTFKTLSLDFQKSTKWRDLSPLTRKDYLNCHNHIIATQTGSGIAFGDQPFAKWTTGTIRKYVDFRGEDSRSRANKELSYIKTVLKYAYQYDKITDNISVGVTKLNVAARQHYATDKDFNFLLQVAKESAFWYLPFAMTIAYQARMRLAEVLDLTDAAEQADGLYIARRKGSKDNIMLWTDSTKAAWEAAKAKRNSIIAKRKMPQQIDPARRYICISERTGDRITTSAFESAKKRIDKTAKAKAEQLGIDYTHFTFHELKKKGISDYKGNDYDKMQASGHRSLDMMKIYNLGKAKVKATTED